MELFLPDGNEKRQMFAMAPFGVVVARKRYAYHPGQVSDSIRVFVVPQSSAPASPSQHSRSALLVATTAGSHELVMVFDALGERLFAGPNERAQEHLGLPIAQVPQRFRDLASPSDKPQLDGAWSRVLQREGSKQAAVLHTPNGAKIELSIVNCLGVAGIEGVMVHIRRRPGSQPSLPPAGATRPPPSREGFSTRVRAAITRATAEADYNFSVLVIDLDRIKVLVGGYGQQMVRALMEQVSERVGALLRPQDIQMSLGVGEIGVFLDDISDRDEVGELAERMLQTVTTSYRVGGKLIRVTGVVGVATSERSYLEPEQVIRDAALACERARSRGRNRREVFRTQMRLEDTMMLSLAGELHQAIYNEQLELHYQPIVSLKTGKLNGFEALLRWRHDLRGMVPPGQFIPIAEESALIIPIGEWVLREACRTMSAWRAREGGANLFVSVNLSAKQFASQELTSKIEQALSGSGLPADRLKLEITESAVMAETDAAVVLLNKMRDMGVGISLDDFGTGYASFSYLHKLPYDTLKIDRSFVSRLDNDEQSQRIVEAIVVLARNLQMDVVAEGVETTVQREHLHGMGCEMAQGYLFAPPLTGIEVEQLIAADRSF